MSVLDSISKNIAIYTMAKLPVSNVDCAKLSTACVCGEFNTIQYNFKVPKSSGAELIGWDKTFRLGDMKSFRKIQVHVVNNLSNHSNGNIIGPHSGIFSLSQSLI